VPGRAPALRAGDTARCSRRRSGDRWDCPLELLGFTPSRRPRRIWLPGACRREPAAGRTSPLDVRLRCAIPLALIVLLMSASPAEAKGDVKPRGYAVLTGPGLRHPVVISAPWDPAQGGYYGTEAEYFIGFAESTGAIPAGKVGLGGGEYEYEGVLPVTGEIHRDALGPRYQLTWFRDDGGPVVRQDIYPNIGGGLPYVFTHHSSRKGLLFIFGRFQYRPDVWTGWGKATDGNLLLGLESKGVPVVLPETTTTGYAPGGVPSSQASPSSIQPVRRADRIASEDVADLAGLALLTTGSLLLLLRRRSAVA